MRSCKQIKAAVVEEYLRPPNWRGPKALQNSGRRPELRMAFSQILDGIGKREMGRSSLIDGGDVLGIGTITLCFQFLGKRRAKTRDRL